MVPRRHQSSKMALDQFIEKWHYTIDMCHSMEGQRQTEPFKMELLCRHRSELLLLLRRLIANIEATSQSVALTAGEVNGAVVAVREPNIDKQHHSKSAWYR
ncbi:uncharacterized protein LOC109545655 isoform X4 [Dendroctonus ponderosae]|uniref:uncharacterized protein LOC109545655 isoform X4 n=1 Tax=Dendroctonus ponderosae TaxID=77166 RepID=UPI0020355392|nr:uncharacterized protein LOC109545655 isoform X4 [Dendroctonus ponderosae]